MRQFSLIFVYIFFFFFFFAILFITYLTYHTESTENTLLMTNIKLLQLQWKTIILVCISLLLLSPDQPNLFNFFLKVMVLNPPLSSIVVISTAFLHLIIQDPKLDIVFYLRH